MEPKTCALQLDWIHFALWSFNNWSMETMTHLVRWLILIHRLELISHSRSKCPRGRRWKPGESQHVNNSMIDNPSPKAWNVFPTWNMKRAFSIIDLCGLFSLGCVSYYYVYARSCYIHICKRIQPCHTWMFKLFSLLVDVSTCII